MNDLSAIPSSQVVYMLMNSLKSKSNVYGYIVSGYPRHIKDVEVYSQKVIAQTLIIRTCQSAITSYNYSTVVTNSYNYSPIRQYA